jgi:hypothetical protein
MLFLLFLDGSGLSGFLVLLLLLGFFHSDVLAREPVNLGSFSLHNFFFLVNKTFTQLSIRKELVLRESEHNRVAFPLSVLHLFDRSQTLQNLDILIPQFFLQDRTVLEHLRPVPFQRDQRVFDGFAGGKELGLGGEFLGGAETESLDDLFLSLVEGLVLNVELVPH